MDGCKALVAGQLFKETGIKAERIHGRGYTRPLLTSTSAFFCHGSYSLRQLLSSTCTVLATDITQRSPQKCSHQAKMWTSVAD